ncbi:MAG: hypothetical protein PUH11_03050 [Bacilli bacterium]|nr:hypothetical protein [Bacilli bacterium]
MDIAKRISDIYANGATIEYEVNTERGMVRGLRTVNGYLVKIAYERIERNNKIILNPTKIF